MFRVPDSSWGESTIDFSNAPAPEANPIGSGSVAVTGYNAISLGAGAMHEQPVPNVLRQVGRQQQLAFNSKRSATNKPELVVVFDDAAPTATPTSTPTIDLPDVHADLDAYVNADLDADVNADLHTDVDSDFHADLDPDVDAHVDSHIDTTEAASRRPSRRSPTPSQVRLRHDELRVTDDPT